MARKYVVRTFGCQMNEHDSERIAGLLAAEGMEPADDVESLHERIKVAERDMLTAWVGRLAQEGLESD